MLFHERFNYLSQVFIGWGVFLYSIIIQTIK